jgi:hypothetical protein
MAVPEHRGEWRLVWADPEARIDIDAVLKMRDKYEAPPATRLSAAATKVPLAMKLNAPEGDP